MKSMFSVPVLVLAAAVLSGCSGEQPVVLPDKNEGVAELPSSGDWVRLLDDGKTVECSVVENGTAMKIFAKGKAYRTEMETDGRDHISVSDGKALWTWVEGDSQGMRMEFSCMDDIRATIPDGAGPAPEYAASPEEVLGERSGFVCAEADSMIDVSAPEGLAFVDQCELIKARIKTAEYFSDGVLPQYPGLADER